MRHGIYITPEKDRKIWYFNNLLHREDGPAVEYYTGRKEWYQHGVFYRDYGPAIEDGDESELWFFNGSRVTEDEFNLWLQKKALNEKLHATLSELPKIKKGKI